MQSGIYCTASAGNFNVPGEHLERQAVNCTAPMITTEKSCVENVLQSVSHCFPTTCLSNLIQK